VAKFSREFEPDIQKLCFELADVLQFRFVWPWLSQTVLEEGEVYVNSSKAECSSSTCISERIDFQSKKFKKKDKVKSLERKDEDRLPKDLFIPTNLRKFGIFRRAIF
jgi:hypothetical protein